MKKNIGKGDRIFRLVLGILVLGTIGFVGGFWPKVALVIVGLFSIYEALSGWCAFYALIGRDTCPIE